MDNSLHSHPYVWKNYKDCTSNATGCMKVCACIYFLVNIISDTKKKHFNMRLFKKIFINREGVRNIMQILVNKTKSVSKSKLQKDQLCNFSYSTVWKERMEQNADVMNVNSKCYSLGPPSPFINYMHEQFSHTIQPQCINVCRIVFLRPLQLNPYGIIACIWETSLYWHDRQGKETNNNN